MVNNWIFFVSRRFSRVDRTGRSAATNFLASLGICFGVMSLIVILAVMNGFQMGSIEAIMEISSFHVRAVPDKEMQPAESLEAVEKIAQVTGIRSVVPMYEAQALVVGRGGRQKPALIRGISTTIMEDDVGFAGQVTMESGSFSIEKPGTVVLGRLLARNLGVGVGDTINLLAMSGGSETDLFAENRLLEVSGIFASTYSDINGTFAFVSLETAAQLAGSGASLVYGIKLVDSESDARIITRLSDTFPRFSYESWRSYNRSFFGVLRLEKNILIMIALLIFVVVAVNIYNSMRRMVYERREEIAVMSALGARKSGIRNIFLFQGLVTGITGSVPGLLIGLAICINMKQVFVWFSSFAFNIQYFFTLIFSPQTAPYLKNSTIYLFYSTIPARPFFSEVLMIFLFGILSSFVASWAASRHMMKFSVAEVLHDE